MEQKNVSVAEQKEHESISMGVLKEIKRQGMVGLASTIVVAAVVGALCAYQMSINYRNDQDWRELFGSYDYVAQDGGGYNNINTGTQGDVNNGAESEDKE